MENFEKAVKKLRDEDVKAQREFMEGYVKMKKKASTNSIWGYCRSVR